MSESHSNVVDCSGSQVMLQSATIKMFIIVALARTAKYASQVLDLDFLFRK
jgi:hypothetical protein